MEDRIFCVAVFRPFDTFSNPLSRALADSYVESVLNGSRTWATAGVERNDEEREGAFLKI